MDKRKFIKRCLAVSSGTIICPWVDTLAFGTPQRRDRYSRVALFQEESAKGVMCRICPNECVLKEGEISDCKNRKVKDSVLHTMAYGNPCAVNIDPVEKKPLYHFRPGTRALSIATAGCNLACLNCQNWTISQTSPDKTTNVELMPDKVIELALQNKSESIAYTYSEPVTFYEYMYETSLLAHNAGINNIVVSNGYINREPLKQLCGVADAANIDLKAFTEKTYLKLTGAKLQPVLDSLLQYRDEGVWLEITNLVIPGWTDNFDEIKDMCRWLYNNGLKDAPLHFSRFQPLYKLEQLPPTPVSVLEKARQLAIDEGIQYVYIGNVPGSDATNTICPGCKNKVVERRGYTITAYSITDGKCEKCGMKINGVWN